MLRRARESFTAPASFVCGRRPPKPTKPIVPKGHVAALVGRFQAVMPLPTQPKIKDSHHAIKEATEHST